MGLARSTEVQNRLLGTTEIGVQMNDELLNELEELQNLLSECKILIDSAFVLGHLHEGTADLIGKHLSTMNQRYKSLISHSGKNP